MDPEDAIWTIILAPIGGIILWALFQVMSTAEKGTRPEHSAPLRDAHESLSGAVDTAFALIQLVGNIEFLLAVAVLIAFVLGLLGLSGR